jgi:hypothetical protein
MGWRWLYGAMALGALLALGCGRTSLDAGSVTDTGGTAATEGGRSSTPVGSAGRSGAPTTGVPMPGTGGMSATSGGASGSAGGVGGASGSAGGGAAFVDRCATPGPAPAVGDAGGRDYHFGEVLEAIDADWTQLAVADFDGDGRPDIAAAESSAPVTVYRQMAAGKLDAGTEVPNVVPDQFAPPLGLTVLDVNGDAALDLAVGRINEHGLAWFANDGAGRFPSGDQAGGASILAPLPWDVDGDGDQDVVALGDDANPSSEKSELMVFVNDAGALSLARRIPLERRVNQLKLADVTGDGKPEVLVSQSVIARVFVFTQQDFASVIPLQEVAPITDPGPTSMWFTAGDLGGDGVADLVIVLDERDPDIERVWVAWSANGGLGQVDPLETLPKDAGNIAGGQPVIADLNLDGRADLAVTSIAFDMVALIRVPGGGFQRVVKPYPSFGSVIPTAIAVGDLNCDGCPDVLGSQAGHVRLFTGVGCARAMK